MINPNTYARREPFKDFKIRDEVCRKLEQVYELSVDNGRDQDPAAARPHRLRDVAATVEAHTGQQSFEGYTQEHRAAIMASMESAASWKEVHAILGQFGVGLVPHGNGLSIKDLYGRHAIKASALDRSLSMKHLVDRFGAFRPPEQDELKGIEEIARFSAKPLQRDPEREKLFASYQAGIEERKQSLANIADEQAARLAQVEELYAQKLKSVRASWAISKRDKLGLSRKLLLEEKEAAAKVREDTNAQRQTVRENLPYTSWAKFLQWQAEEGNEVALAILRSRKVAVEPEADAQAHADGHRQESYGKTPWHQNVKAIRSSSTLSRKDKRALVAVARMEQVKSQRSSLLSDFTYTVDAKGTVLFRLSGGGYIRDSGAGITWSPGDQQAVKVAKAYAALRLVSIDTTKEEKQAARKSKGLER